MLVEPKMNQPICVGLIIYHGPREFILPFFSQLGFQCPQRKGVADFVQEVVSAKDQKVLKNLAYPL